MWGYVPQLWGYVPHLLTWLLLLPPSATACGNGPWVGMPEGEPKTCIAYLHR